MARVTVEDCILRVPNRFDLVILAAQRARDLSAGAPPSLPRDNDKNPVIGLREIAESTIDGDDLRQAIVSGMQKHVDLDELEEENEGVALPSVEKEWSGVTEAMRGVEEMSVEGAGDAAAAAEALVDEEGAEDAAAAAEALVDEEGAEDAKAPAEVLVDEEGAEDAKAPAEALVDEDGAEDAKTPAEALVDEEGVEDAKAPAEVLVDEEGAEDAKAPAEVLEEKAGESDGGAKDR